MRKFKFGWFGDNGLGEILIQRILAGAKTACTAPAYDPVDRDVQAGETVLLVDKTGAARGVLKITSVEIRPYGLLDDALARREGMTVEELKARLDFANSRKLSDDEEMRVILFETVSREPPA